MASGKGDAPPVNTTPSLSDTFMPPELTGYISSNSNVDLDDWVNNADPGTATEKTYYNPKDKKFYCVVRTRHWDPYYYDIIHYAETDTNDWRLGTQPGPGLEVATNNVNKAMTLGITKILKATGKYDLAENNLRFLLESSPKKAYFMTHKDLRPASRWVYAVTVDREDLEQLGDQTTVSYQEDSLTPLQ